MDRESLEDLFAPFGAVRVKRMFGGQGIFADDVMIGLVGDGQIFLKADQQTEARFKAEGCEPFLYERGDKKISLGYWSLPDKALDDPDEMKIWSRLALEAARRKKASSPKPKSKPKTKKTKGQV